MSHGKRKFEALDVVNMAATLKPEDWKYFLKRASLAGNINKLMSYRYGLQAGLADAASKGVSTPEMDIWVMKLIRNIEQCAKWIFRNKHPMPGDKVVIPKYAKGRRIDYVQDVLEAKKKRDREFQDFLMRSNF